MKLTCLALALLASTSEAISPAKPAIAVQRRGVAADGMQAPVVQQPKKKGFLSAAGVRAAIRATGPGPRRA